MKRSVLVLFVVALFSSAYASQKVTAERLEAIAKRLGYETVVKYIDRTPVVMVKTRSGYLFWSTENARVDLISLSEKRYRGKDVLERINRFNERIIFAEAFLHKGKVGIGMNMAAIEGASDEMLVRFLGKFLVLKEVLNEYFGE